MVEVVVELLDIQTLVLVANLVALVTATVFALAVRALGFVSRPLTLWTWALFAKAVGLVLLWLRSTIPDPISYSLANTLVVVSAQLFLVGTLEFVERPQSLRTHAWFPPAALVGIACLFQWCSYAVAVAGLTVPIVVFDVAAAVTLVRWSAPRMRTAQTVIAAVFGLEALFLTLRVAILPINPTQSTVQPSVVIAVFYLHVVLGTILLGTGLLVLLYQKAQLAERDRVAELQTALAEVRTLEGMLPICAWCKRIRDEEDHWQPVERYLVSRTDASFSHSICPECAERFEQSRGAAPRPTT